MTAAEAEAAMEAEAEYADAMMGFHVDAANALLAAAVEEGLLALVLLECAAARVVRPVGKMSRNTSQAVRLYCRSS